MRQWGFSAQEKRAIIFLVVIILLGSSYRYYQNVKLNRFVEITPESPLILDDEMQNPPHVASEDRPLNINSASQAEFELLPGIGPVLAARIISYRDSIGPFKDILELDNVYGIGKHKMAQIINLVVLDTTSLH